MTVQVTETVEWVHQCYEHEGDHEHVSLYLLRAGEDAILVDSGSFYHREAIADAIDDATGGEGPDAIVLSHSDYPHAANVSPYPVQASTPYRCECGGAFGFVDPPLADRSHTTWIYDHGDGVLFTADGFGNYHEPGQCRYLSGDFADVTPAERIYEYHRDNLVWLRYVAPEKVERTLDDIFERFDVNAVAPIHGNPIEGDDLPVYRERLSDAIRRIADEYEVA
ncbi:hypothetical protein BRC67_05935 [Halobacteriales archaeon QH_3_68_24]|nr:MAG: hypothetical protein BRC67_05935 [Halobacteriales archaeon QH_3_68_24]